LFFFLKKIIAVEIKIGIVVTEFWFFNQLIIYQRVFVQFFFANELKMSFDRVSRLKVVLDEVIA
jgi:hypothetical protein